MTPPWPTTPPTPAELRAFADASTRPFWLDDLPRRDPHPRLESSVDADLCIVGGGFTGLWAALHARRDAPGRNVVLLESGRCGEAASGRNGGFLDASLTHGLANGCSRFADEMPALERLGGENFAALRADLQRHSIDADYEGTGTLDVALEPHQVTELDELAALTERFGHEARRLDREAMRAEVSSPTYLAGLWTPHGTALVHPGKLGDGLRRAAAAAGVAIFEHSPVHALAPEGAGIAVTAADGRVHARRVLVATGAETGVLPTLRRYIAPVYDYALVTEPLSPAQLGEIGWRRRQGLADGANQFHYYRLTRDDRILFGGYDAVYRYGGPVGPRHEDHAASFGRAVAALLHHLPAAGRAALHATAGAARSTPAAASRCSSESPIMAVSRTRPGTRDSASAPAGSGRRSRWTCSTVATPRPPDCASRARARCRSRPSRCARR